MTDQTAAPADPMDWPLPCAVKVGHGTHGKGTPLRTLVKRMQLLYNMVQESASASMRAPAPAASVEPADIVNKLRSLKVLLGTDSPEVRGWAPAVQQQAQKVVNEAIAALAAAAQPAPVATQMQMLDHLESLKTEPAVLARLRAAATGQQSAG